MAGFEEKTVEIKVLVPDQDMDSGGRYALVGFDVKSVDPLQDFGLTDAQSGNFGGFKLRPLIG